MTVDISTYTREELISICEAAVRPESVWHDRDSARSYGRLGQCWALLKAGCEFIVLDEGEDEPNRLNTDERTIWLRVKARGFAHFDWGGEYDDELFYLPTRERLEKCGEKDWY